jgi:hypothetical protein
VRRFCDIPKVLVLLHFRVGERALICGCCSPLLNRDVVIIPVASSEPRSQPLVLMCSSG